jgi:hypothetical protein
MTNSRGVSFGHHTDVVIKSLGMGGILQQSQRPCAINRHTASTSLRLEMAPGREIFMLCSGACKAYPGVLVFKQQGDISSAYTPGRDVQPSQLRGRRDFLLCSGGCRCARMPIPDSSSRDSASALSCRQHWGIPLDA